MVTQKTTNNNRYLRESYSENADKLDAELEYPRNCVEFPKRKAESISRKSRENRGLAVFPAWSILRRKRETAACNLRRGIRRRRSVVLGGFHAAQPDHLVHVVLDGKEHAGLLAVFLHPAEQAEDHQRQNQSQRRGNQDCHLPKRVEGGTGEQRGQADDGAGIVVLVQRLGGGGGQG